MNKNKHVGSTLQSFFEETGEWEEVKRMAKEKGESLLKDAPIDDTCREAARKIREAKSLEGATNLLALNRQGVCARIIDAINNRLDPDYSELYAPKHIRTGLEKSFGIIADILERVTK